MDLEKTLQFLEEYSRGYIYYVFDFIRGKASENEDASITAVNGKVIIFAVLSLFIGTIFRELYIENVKFDNINYESALAIEIPYWITLSWILHVIVRSPKEGVTYINSLAIVITVFSCGYMIGGYAAFVASNCVRAFTYDITPADAAWQADLFGQFAVSAIYIALYVYKLPTKRVVRKISGIAFILTTVALVDLTAGWGADHDKSGQKTSQSAPAAKKGH